VWLHAGAHACGKRLGGSAISPVLPFGSLGQLSDTAMLILHS